MLVSPRLSISTSLSSLSTLFTFHLASIIAIPPSYPPPLCHYSHPPPLFLFLHSRHSELFSMSFFIAGARSQLQLITEHRAGGTRSAFRSALSLHFAINPFHTKPHHHLHPPLHHTHFLHLSLLYFSTHADGFTSLPPLLNLALFLQLVFC